MSSISHRKNYGFLLPIVGRKNKFLHLTAKRKISGHEDRNLLST